MEFRILGPVGIWSHDNEIPLRGFKERTIFAALLLSNGWTISDTQLGETLWGKRPPVTYQAQIYTYASRLRRHLADAASIDRQGHGYAMKIGSARFDLREFETMAREGRIAAEAGQPERAARLLHAALALWRGPTLTDVTESLAESERPRIEMARMDALESRIEADLMLGRHRQLTAELTGLTSAHPLREGFRAKLMTALYRCDRQAEAFAVYHEGCRLLRDELGVDPGPTLRRAHHALLTDDTDRLFRYPPRREVVTAAGRSPEAA